MVTLKAVSILAFTSWKMCASALGDMPRCFWYGSGGFHAREERGKAARWKAYKGKVRQLFFAESLLSVIGEVE